jgi:hypothetical protein
MADIKASIGITDAHFLVSHCVMTSAMDGENAMSLDFSKLNDASCNIKSNADQECKKEKWRESNVEIEPELY